VEAGFFGETRVPEVLEKGLCYTIDTMNPVPAPELARETVGGEPYEYYPLGEYVVIAPDVCGGRPTFKYTRLEVSVILSLLGDGWSIDEVAAEYEQSNLRRAAIREALQLADEAFTNRAQAIYPLAV